jgi:putative ABC transport system permease protein
VLSDAQAQADLERPLASGTQSIAFINALLWLVAAGIIGSIVYLSALERQREFAVLKATGAANRSLLTGLALQRSATARAVKHAVVTGYSARDFRELVGSGRVAEAIKHAWP